MVPVERASDEVGKCWRLLMTLLRYSEWVDHVGISKDRTRVFTDSFTINLGGYGVLRVVKVSMFYQQSSTIPID